MDLDLLGLVCSAKIGPLAIAIDRAWRATYHGRLAKLLVQIYMEVFLILKYFVSLFCGRGLPAPVLCAHRCALVHRTVNGPSLSSLTPSLQQNTKLLQKIKKSTRPFPRTVL
jgi:hypothetical protein